MKTPYFFLTVAAIFFYTGLIQAEEQMAWQEPSLARRLPLKIPAADGGQPITVPVLVTGRDFFQWTGFPRPLLDSLRLHDSHGKIEIQTEEYDSEGKILVPGDQYLDDSDLIAFTIRLDKEAQTVFLYYDGSTEAASPAPSAVEILIKEGDLVPLQLRSGDLMIGLRGGGEPPFDNKQVNHGRGAIARWIWKTANFADMQKSWTDYFPHCLGTGPGAPAWTGPQVILKGPVRTIVEMQCKGLTEKSGEKGILKGDIVRRIAVWSESPTVDFEETVRYTAADFEYRWHYDQMIPLGKSLGDGDRLIVPVGGKPYEISLGKLKNELGKNPWLKLYETCNPEEGWLAFQDCGEGNGIAVFYEKLDPIRMRSAWLTYRPALNPELYVRATTSQKLELRLSFRDRASCTRNEIRRPIRYMVLSSESTETIRQCYAFWCSPEEGGISTGKPEIRSYLE